MTGVPFPDLLAAVDRQHLPCNPARALRCEEQYTVRNVLRRTEPLERNSVDQRALTLLAIRLPLSLRRGVRPHEAGGNVVHGDTPRPELVRELSREPDLGRLRGRI